MTQFFLIRHGQALTDASGNGHLSPLGWQQARWLGDYFRTRGIGFQAVITGSLVRHVETADGIQQGLGSRLLPEVQPGLNEFPFFPLVRAYLRLHPGEAPPSGAPPATVYRLLRKVMTAWRERALEGTLPESWPDFQTRVADVMASMQRTHAQCDHVLVVSSGGAIALWVHHILHTTDEASVELNLQIRNSSVTTGFFNRRVFRLSTFNEVPHLDRIDRLTSITYT